jgi:hyperosmotically inducible protein
MFLTLLLLMKKERVMKHVFIAVLAFFLSGCAIFQGKSTPDQYAQDTSATTQIKSKLVGSDIVSAPNIHVETQNGVVQLSGFVSTRDQVQEAGNIAQSVPNVKSVVNDLVVTPSKHRPRQRG